MSSKTFGQDAEFLKQHTDAIVLSRDDQAIVVVPDYQGRVMTATAGGADGASSGWINYELVEQGVLPPEEAAGKLEEHMYAFGGEERFWMGPEGGQYSIFFAPGTPFEFSDWYTPDPIDSESWKVVSQTDDAVVLTHQFPLQNHSGTRFRVAVRRGVKLLEDQQVGKLLGVQNDVFLKMVQPFTVTFVFCPVKNNFSGHNMVAPCCIFLIQRLFEKVYHDFPVCLLLHCQGVIFFRRTALAT